MDLCKNCDASLSGLYCSTCGQKDVELERPLFALMSEALRETFDVDGRAARSLWTLLRRPGVLTRDYLEGRRKRYASPLRLYLIISVLFFVLTAWVAGQGIFLGDGQTLETDAAGQAHVLTDYVPRLMFVLLPVFALLLKLAFRKRLLFDHLIHALHLHSLAYLALAVMLPLERAADKFTPVLAIQFLLLGYLMASFVISVRRVYRVGWLMAAAKTIGITLAYIAITAASVDGISQLLSPGSGDLMLLDD